MKKRIFGITSILLVVALLVSLFFIFDFSSWLQKTIQAPTISLNATEETLSWDDVTYAEKYDIYLNDALIDTINSSTKNVYNFVNALNDEEIIYHFYIIAKAEGYNDSKKSNVATFIKENGNVSETLGISIINDNNSIKNIAINGTAIFWDKVDSVSEYYVLIIDNTNGTRLVETTTNGLNFESYVISGQILAFRVGIKNTQDEVCFSDFVYYNDAVNVKNYESDLVRFNEQFNNIVLFQGKFYDHYIINQEELNILFYYGFLNKLNTIDVAISPQFYNTLYNQYKGSSKEFAYLIGDESNYYKYPGIVSLASSSFTETCDYAISIDLPDANSTDKNITATSIKRHFIIYYTYNGGVNPTLTMQKSLVQNVSDIGYYDKVNYQKRSVYYDNFISDHHSLIATCNSSEQLYSAVENKTTPIFTSTSSKAYLAYNRAKEILRQIISDEMTEFEKALSIFDWICLNTVYDHNIVNYSVDSEPSFTDYTAFSLEGVLFDGLAVCDGFSKTFSLLCNMEGIDAVKISGSINGRSDALHAWNKVKIDGVWYVVDITWSVFDTNSYAVYPTSLKLEPTEFINHQYFLVSDAEIADHYPANEEFNNKFPASTSYFYYDKITYDGANNYVVQNLSEFESIISYMLENKIYSLDIAFDSSVYGTFTSTSVVYPIINNQLNSIINQLPENVEYYIIGGSRISYLQGKYAVIFTISLITNQENIAAA